MIPTVGVEGAIFGNMPYLWKGTPKLEDGTTDDFDSVSYIELEKTDESKRNPKPDDGELFKFVYVPSTGTTINKYKVFSTKLVLTGTPTKSDVPEVKNLRSFALTKS